MKAATPISPWRREARTVIHQVIEDHVLGPAQCLPHEDVLELRKVLRVAYRDTFGGFGIYPYRIWCEEVRSALGYPILRRVRKKKSILYSERNVMPAMRDWARRNGLIVDESATASVE